MVCIQDDVIVRDLNSTNGTFLNSQRVQDMAGLRNGNIVQFGNAVFTIRQQSGQSANATVAADVAHEAIAHLQFEKLLKNPEVIPFFQPIVRLDDLQCVGYEVLARSKHPYLRDEPGISRRKCVFPSLIGRSGVSTRTAD